MDPSPTIDRKRLERYPLGSHPSTTLAVCVPAIGMVVYLYFLLSSVLAPIVESAPTDIAVPWLFEMIFARPWLALVFGGISGAACAWWTRPIDRRQLDHDVDLYFLTRTARLRALRTREIRKTRVHLLGRILISLLVLVGMCALIGMNLKIGLYSFAASYMLVHSPRLFTRHAEILRRRRIALAWENIDPPDDTLSREQKAYASLFVVLGGAFVACIGYFAYDLKTDSTFDWILASAYLDGGARLSLHEAGELEHRLAVSPDDHVARLKLLGYHLDRSFRDETADDQAAAPAYHREMRTHALFFVEHTPGHAFAEHARMGMPFRTDDPDYLAFSDAWRNQVDRFPNDPDVLWNAAKFVGHKDDDYFQSLLERGQVLEPEEARWSAELNKQRLRRSTP